jgi:hypothetical protein
MAIQEQVMPTIQDLEVIIDKLDTLFLLSIIHSYPHKIRFFPKHKFIIILYYNNSKMENDKLIIYNLAI